MARLTGDIGRAEDAVQEACAAAVAQWPTAGVPSNPGGWLTAVARRKAIDALRREAVRGDKEQAAVTGWRDDHEDGAAGTAPADDQLALLFTCCHPALNTSARVALTLRVVCGVPTRSIAALLLMPEPRLAQQLVRAKRKIRDAVITLAVPDERDRPARLASVLQVVYLAFTEGHYAHTGTDLVREDLCEETLQLARALHALLPDEPEVAGLLALILLTDARRPARVDPDGAMVLLENQDRTRWDRAKIGEGVVLLEHTLARRRPGPLQLQAAIAACHTEARAAVDTDWAQIAVLYRELTAVDPSPVIEANRAVAVAMTDGPAAGLALLDALLARGALAGWAQLHTARGGLLTRLGRAGDAATAYRAALALDPPEAERRFLTTTLAALAAQQATDNGRTGIDHSNIDHSNIDRIDNGR